MRYDLWSGTTFLGGVDLHESSLAAGWLLRTRAYTTVALGLLVTSARRLERCHFRPRSDEELEAEDQLQQFYGTLRLTDNTGTDVRAARIELWDSYPSRNPPFVLVDFAPEEPLAARRSRTRPPQLGASATWG